MSILSSNNQLLWNNIYIIKHVNSLVPEDQIRQTLHPHNFSMGVKLFCVTTFLHVKYSSENNPIGYMQLCGFMATNNALKKS